MSHAFPENMNREPTYSIVPVPAFRDNYIWILRDDRHAVVVDPGEALPVLDYLGQQRLRLVSILATHHHADHVGGIAEILQHHDVPVCGPKNEPIETLTRTVGGGDRVEIAEIGAVFDVIDVPGHTRAHIAYYGGNTLLCGDTLFACGCGRVFEGTPQQLHASLMRLAALPDETRVYCAHEYTLANIRFARAVEPGNEALAARERIDARLRQQDRPTVPSTMGIEKATNPFLRCSRQAVIESAGRHHGSPLTDPAQVFTAIRKWKNEF